MANKFVFIVVTDTGQEIPTIGEYWSTNIDSGELWIKTGIDEVARFARGRWAYVYRVNPEGADDWLADNPKVVDYLYAHYPHLFKKAADEAS